MWTLLLILVTSLSVAGTGAIAPIDTVIQQKTIPWHDSSDVWLFSMFQYSDPPDGAEKDSTVWDSETFDAACNTFSMWIRPVYGGTLAKPSLYGYMPGHSLPDTFAVCTNLAIVYDSVYSFNLDSIKRAVPKYSWLPMKLMEINFRYPTCGLDDSLKFSVTLPDTTIVTTTYITLAREIQLTVDWIAND